MGARSFVPLAAAALAACSGASAQLVSSPPDAGAAASSGASSASGSRGGASSSGQGSGAGATGGAPGADDDAATSSGTTECPVGGTMQTTAGGDSALDATPFDRIACGVVTAGESYFWSFTLPASASKFGLSFSGGVRLSLTLDGETASVIPGAELPFRTNDPYVLEVAAPGNDPAPYVLVVTEK